MFFNLVWTKEDTFKALGLILFITAFYVVYQQLQQAERRLQENEKRRASSEGVKKDWLVHIAAYLEGLDGFSVL